MKYNFKLVTFLLLFVVLISIISYKLIVANELENILIEEKNSAKIEFNSFNKSFDTYLSSVENIINSINNNSYFQNFLLNKKDIKYTQELFLSIASNSADIFQLRYLDKNGKEIIRVDKKNNLLFLVKELQDKSNRYYFYDTKKSNPNKFWYSKFDLNVEHKAIEIPYKPTLRVSKAIYTNDKFNGIVIVNIDMKYLLNMLFNDSKMKKVLLDKSNNILYSNDNNLNFWTKYLGGEKFISNDKNILLENNINLNNKEGLKLKIYYENCDTKILLTQFSQKVIILILLIDLVIFIILLFAFKNSYLNTAIKNALKERDELHSKIDSFVIMSKTDSKGNITYVTDEFCRLTGYQRDELIGKKHSIIKDPETPRKIYEDLWDTISKGQIFHTKMTILTKNQEKRYWDINIFPQKDTKGNIIEYIAYRRDETAQAVLKEHNEILKNEVSKRTKELLKRQERILELSKVKEQFLSNMSHEIRTPLNGIVGMVDILLNDTQCPSDVKERLNIIKSSSNILTNVVNDILDFTALKSGKIKIYDKEFCLKEMVKNTKALMENSIKDKGLEFNVNIDESIDYILVADEFRINQIIMNLISNARKFTNKGFVNFNIKELNKTSEFVTLEFSVIDTGIGMDEEVQKNIFTEFNQSDKSNTSKHRGTGLGLAICKYLVDLMGGKIWFESDNIKGGTKFYFTLNLKYTNQNNIKNISSYDRFVLLKEKKTALLVEDDTINQIVAKNLLEKIGFEVEIANNGLEAVHCVSKKDYDIIFMDIQMPVMNGHEATIKIKEFDKKTPIIALSAGAMQDDIQKSYEVGIDIHISKPIVMSEINFVIDKYFEVS